MRKGVWVVAEAMRCVVNHHPFVMAGLVPAIHVLLSLCIEDVDARDKPGHDELRKSRLNWS